MGGGRNLVLKFVTTRVKGFRFLRCNVEMSGMDAYRTRRNNITFLEVYCNLPQKFSVSFFYFFLKFVIFLKFFKISSIFLQCLQNFVNFYTLLFRSLFKVKFSIDHFVLGEDLEYSKFRIILFISVCTSTLHLTLPYFLLYITSHLTLHYHTSCLTLPYHTLCLTLLYYTLP